MDPQIPAVVNLVACGPTRHYFRRIKHDRFTMSVNNCHVGQPSFTPDLICAMDDLERDEDYDGGKYVRDIVEAGCRVLTTGRKAKWPATMAYPLAEVIDWLGMPPDYACKILTNTINYSLAYLGAAGAKEINLFGVDFTNYDSRGVVERQINFLDKDKWPDWTIYYMEALIRQPTEPGLDGCNWLMGYLTGKGVTIGLLRSGNGRMFRGTTLLDLDRPNFFYGYQEDPYF